MTKTLPHAAALALALATALAAPSALARDKDRWQPCAGEGQLCRFEGEALVRYGTDGRWIERRATDRVRCDNERFGDPAYGQYKRCEVKLERGRPDRPDRDRARWDFCAGEGQWCRVNGRVTVRYGDEGRYVEREVRGGIACTNEAFGRDPLPGEIKRCDVKR